MHVERKPPLWPYLAVLMLLLGLCVAAPRYWDVVVTRQDPAVLTSPEGRSRPLPLVARSCTSGVRVYLPAPMAELVPSPSATHRPWRPDGPTGRLVLIPPDEPSLNAVIPGVDLAAAIREIGHRGAAVQPGQLMPLVAALVADRMERLPPAPRVVASPPTLIGPLLVTSPTDRLAMMPDRAAATPSLQLPSLGVAPDPWETALPSVSETRGVRWQVPWALVEQLERLERFPTSAAWATRTLAEIAVLTDRPGLSDDEVSDQLGRIGRLADEATELVAAAGDERLATELRRAQYAIQRRIEVWSLVQGIRSTGDQTPHARLEGDRLLRDALDQLTQLTGESQRGSDWRDYLLTASLAKVADAGARTSPAGRRELARQILDRVSTDGLSWSQQHFVTSEPIAALTGELRHWAAERVDLDRLTVSLETYERSRSPRVAQAIALERRKLAWSPNHDHRRLAENIDLHYRNANFRIAVTAELLEQLLPQPEPAGYQPVRDRIVGTPVRGRQRTEAALSTRLVPDENVLRFALVARGNVASRTVGYGDGARVWTRGQTDFQAQKFVTITPDGMRIYPAVANAESRTRLVGIRTDYDGLPFLQSWARSEAQNQYRRKRARARAIVEAKVAAQAQADLDSEAGPYLDRLRDRVASRLDELRETGVHVQPIALGTTQQRVVARLRVAGDDQLASHTPRNRAPADSLASVQMHETVLVNLSRCLELDGQRLTAVELRDLIQDRFGDIDTESTDDVPGDTLFHFAYEDALTFQFNNGQMELTVALVELVHGGRTMRNFRVHAFYEPRIAGTRLTLARTGALGIEGRIGTGERARLHAIFNKVLSEDAEIPVLDPERMGLGQLEGVMITQAVLEDGWMGIALGPETAGRTAQRLRSLR